MKYSTLGNSDIKTSLLGYGAWALGKKGWPGVDARSARETLAQCLDLGINFFDTAPIYGFGRSEEILGETLSHVRSRVVIATKCGLVWNERGTVRHDLSRDAVLRDCEQSLKRLKTDYIDLYQIHWPDKRTPIEETMGTLCDLRKQGHIRHIGVSNYSIELLQEACSHADIVSSQNLYNMLQRDAEQDLLPYCLENNIGFICYSPLAQGILGGKIPPGFKPGRHDIRRFNSLFRSSTRLQASISFAQDLGKAPAATALRFLAETPGVSSILVGMTRKEHLLANIEALSIE